MPKTTISPLRWELIDSHSIDETGILYEVVHIYFKTLDADVKIKEFRVKRSTKRFILLDGFFITRDSEDVKEGSGESVYSEIEILDVLEECYGKR